MKLTIARLAKKSMLIVAGLASLGYAQASYAQSTNSTSCLNDIERTMREFQARWMYDFGGTRPQKQRSGGPPKQWIPCCDSEFAPAFPPDDYYDRELQGNVRFGVLLVDRLRSAFAGDPNSGCWPEDQAPVYPLFLKDTFDPEGKIAACPDGDLGCEPDSWPTFASTDFPPELRDCSIPITADNYCEVYQQLVQAIRRLMKVNRPGGCELPANCQHWYNSGISRTSNACQGGEAGYWADDRSAAAGWAVLDAEKCWNAVAETGCPGWRLAGTCAPPLASIPGAILAACGIGVYESGNVAEGECRDENDVTTAGFYASVTYGRKVGRLAANLTGDPGSYSGFAYIEPECGGAELHSPPFAGDRKWHAAFYGSGDSIVLSAPMGDGNVPKTWNAGDLPWVNECHKRGWTIKGVRGILTPRWDTRPDDAKQCGTNCSTCVPGTTKVSATTTGVEASWSLGVGSDGKPAGSIDSRMFSDYRPTSDYFENGFFIVNLRQPSGASPGVEQSHGIDEVTTLATGYTVAFISKDTTGEIVTIEFAHQSQTSLDTTSLGRRVLLTGEQPYAAAQLAYTTTTTGRRLTITATGEMAGKWEITQEGNSTTLRSGLHSDGGSGEVAEARTTISKSTQGTATTFERIIAPDTGAAVARGTETWDVVNDENRVVAMTSGAAGQGLEKTFVYYTDLVMVGAKLGKLRAVLSNRDPWQHFSYDADGRLTRIVSQYKSNAYWLPLTDTELSQLALQNRELRMAHFSVDTSLDADALPEDITETTEFVQNIAVSRMVNVTWSQPESGATQSIFWHVRCADPTPAGSASAIAAQIAGIGTNAPFGSNLVDIEVREPAFPFEMLLHSSSDGRVAKYTRTEASGVKSTQTDEGPGTSDRKGIRTGTGTRTVTHKPLRGEVTAMEMYDLSTTSPVLISSRTSLTDDFGRITTTSHSNGTTTSRQYSCCGLDTETDAFGVMTGYEYDALHRLKRTIHQVGASAFMSTEYVLDAAGRVIEEWKRGTDGTTLTLVSTSEYDLSGQLIATEDASGVRTDYAESVITYAGSSLAVQNVTTLPPMEHNQQVIRPDVVSLQYMDGTPLSRSGNGAHETHTDIGVVVDPIDGVLRYVQSWNGGASSSEWTKQYSNALGQSIKTEYADGSTHRTYFNNKDQAIRSVDPDGVTTLTYRGNGWDDAQALSAPALGTDGWKGDWQVNVAHATVSSWDGTSIAWGGKDRIRRSRSFVGAPDTASGISDSYCFVTLTDEWSTDDSSTAVVQTGAGYSSFDGRIRFQESFGRTSKTVESAPNPSDLGLERTVSTVESQVVTSDRRYGRAVETLSEEGGQFKTKVQFGYDVLGRQTTVSEYFTASATTPTNVTTTTYVGLTDRVATITQPAPAAGQPTLTTTNEYDQSGRVIRVELTGSKEVFQSFLPTGEKSATSGFGVNPVVYAYNDQGRLSTLTTFKDGNTASGPAITTWTYDAQRGWLSEKTYDDGKGWTYSYTPAGRLYTRTSAAPRSIETAYDYNEFGDHQETTYSDGTQSIVQLYDRRGRLKTVIDAAGVRTIARDDAGQVLSESFAADGDSPSLLDGVVVTNTPSTSHIGQRTAHSVEISSYPLNSVAFEYDAADRLWRVTKDGRRAEFTYNARTGQQSGLTQSSLVGATYTPYINLARELDNLGRVGSMHYARSSDNATLSSTIYTYDVYGRRTLGDRDMHDGFEKGARWHYAYDELNQLTSAKRELNGYPGDFAPGQQYEYTYDDIGNRTTTKIGGDQQGNNLVTSSYTSNLLNQYTQRQVPGRIDITGDATESSVVQVNNTIAYRAGRYFWHVIPVNNSTDPVVQEVTTEIIPGDPAWQRFMVAKTPELFTHDADGNLTQDGTFVYQWDGENRLKAMITRAEVGQFITPFRLDFAYDYMGRRIMKRYSRYQGEANELVTTPSGDLKLWAADYEQRFVWDGGLAGGYGNLSASYFYDSIENVFAGADQSYAWGPDLSGSEQGAGGIGGLAIISAAASDLNLTAATYVPLYDGHGNVVSLRDTSTNELAAYTYGPYGETTAAVGPRWASNPFRFSTKFTDAETGLVYYGYRYYMPSVGRWAGRDPIEEDGGIHLYAIAGNAPVEHSDALGLCGKCGAGVDGVLDAVDAALTAAFTSMPRATKSNICEAMVSGSGWDMWELAYDPSWFAQGACNQSGKKCGQGVTVGGACARSYDVNYWLWGRASRHCGKSLEKAATWVAGYRIGRALTRGIWALVPFNGVSIREEWSMFARLAWTEAGYRGSHRASPVGYIGNLDSTPCAPCSAQFAGRVYVYLGDPLSGAGLSFNASGNGTYDALQWKDSPVRVPRPPRWSPRE